ncbi:MAG: oligoendopeptidase F, partial [Sphaerochaetaceae bacterium]
MSANQRIPSRDEVALNDTWDLTHLYSSDQQWTDDCQKVEEYSSAIVKFRGTLKESPENLLNLLTLLDEVGLLIERIAQYSFLLQATDG